MNILVFTKNWLGDVIFETPAIKAIRRNFPDARIVCATPPRAEEILRKNPHVNDVIPFDERTIHRPLREKLRFIMRLRTERFDKAFLFHRSFTRAFLAFAGGVKQRIGYATKSRGPFLTLPVRENGAERHHVYYFLELLAKSGLKIDLDPVCEFFFSEEDDRRASSFLSDKGLNMSFLVALNPGGNRANKRWPAHRFAELADLLLERYGCSFIITGHRKDDALASDISHAAKRAKPVSLCGDTHLGELGAVFSRCKLVISGDSGPLHIAAGVGTNVIALFGPTDPRLTGPIGRGKNVVIRAEDEGREPSMLSIKPERVLEVVEREGLL